jgi:hypothetical protein
LPSLIAAVFLLDIIIYIIIGPERSITLIHFEPVLDPDGE